MENYSRLYYNLGLFYFDLPHYSHNGGNYEVIITQEYHIYEY